MPDWDRVHDVIQSQLKIVADAIVEQGSSVDIEIRFESGKTSSDYCHLLTSIKLMPQSQDCIDPILLTVSFVPAGDGMVQVTGDASGENLGDMIASYGSMGAVPDLDVWLLFAGCQVVGYLGSHINDITNACRDPSRTSP